MQFEVITKDEAESRGLTRYFTGKPCVHGHVAERNLAGACMTCKDEYNRKYYAENGERMREGFKRYAEKNPEIMLRAREKFERLNPGYNSAKHAAKRDERNASSRAYHAQNSDEINARKAKQRRENRAAPSVWEGKRRARKLSAVPPWFGELDDLVALEAADLCQRRELATGAPWHIDHMIPLQAREACGLHCAANLQVIPAAMNLAKGNRMRLTQPGEWIAHL